MDYIHFFCRPRWTAPACVPNDGDNLRILPIAGVGRPRNIRDDLSPLGFRIANGEAQETSNRL
jgi:hypothetical protein